MKTYRILSIESEGNVYDGYDWVSCTEVGQLTEKQLGDLPEMELHKKLEKLERDLMPILITKGILNTRHWGRVELDYDRQGYYVIYDKKTQAPLYAIEHGIYS